MNAIKVLKFGGSSVKNIARIEHVADIIASYKPHPVCVVVSAMGDTTDHLLSLANQCTTSPDQRELDLLLSTGEQISIVLLSLILKKKGIEAKSLTGQQAGIFTSDDHGSARILEINSELIKKELQTHDVVVVAGFQGVTQEGQITTLGRGGSDTTAVALAAALGAPICDIYTDVNGVFTADPNAIENAVSLEEISYSQCVTLARNGAQVIHPRAVELGEQYDVIVRVRNTFNPSHCGTEIKGDVDVEKRREFCGVAVDKNQGFIAFANNVQGFNLLKDATECLSQYGVSVDHIKQNRIDQNKSNIQFCINYKDQDRVLDAVSNIKEKYIDAEISAELDLCKITLVGSDCQGNVSATLRFISCLEDNNIDVLSIRTADNAISCLVRKCDARIAAQLVHEEFRLSNDFNSTTRTEELCLTA